MAGVTP
ncbi:hypothetical protein ECEC4196_5850, partial [Escherichia coli EC4196]